MATLVLTAVGSVLTRGAGGWLGILVGAAASVAGGFLDSLLFGKTVKQEGPRLDNLQVQASTEGAALPEMAGRVRLSGQIIWASRLKEVVKTDKQGGKGGGGGVETKTYTYYANFAVALCEGVIDRVGRVWADGKPLDMKHVTMRVHKGTATQKADSLIQGIEGASSTPAYRGTAYVVFDNLKLTDFGNRIPQLSFEVFRRVSLSDGTALEDAVKAVTLIPGAGEFAYDIVVETRDLGGGVTVPENRHTAEDAADWAVALDDLKASLPNAGTVLLVVGWFGDDLRCGQCTVRPKVETTSKTTTPNSWNVHTLSRSTAIVVSTYNGTSAYGGTPADASVVRAIRDLNARGYKTVFYPFLFMDVAQGNALGNPYSGFASQPAYPWRGRITCDPAPLAQNYLTRTDDLAIWSRNGTPIVTGGQADPFGGTEACTVQDDDGAVTEALNRNGGGTWAAGDRIFVSAYVRKDAAETVAGVVQAYTKTSAPVQYANLTIDVATGSLTVVPSSSVTVHSSGVETVTAPDGSIWFRPWAVISDGVNANAPSMWLIPASGGPGFQGTKTFFGPQIARLGARVDYYRNATTSPAGPTDKTAAAAAQVDGFFGSAAASDISISVNATTNDVTTSYSGPAEWSYRRFILHYAKLCAAINTAGAGWVDGFLIGSELKGLTSVRSASSSFPAVTQLKTLAANVKSIFGIGGPKVGYSADWSEYNNYAPTDGSGDLYFNLDPLWSDSNVDFVGVDTYVPLSDWRDGTGHTDAAAYESIYHPAYLKANIEGGEYFNWYYADAAARDIQVRTEITDGAYGKPWVYRAKDFRNWWLNSHYNRPGGVQSGSPTAWTPQSKPIWFTEMGVPSIDKGTNQPNVFYDPKSSESAAPYYSTSTRDDLIQRRGIEAVLSYWSGANNPVSAVTGDRMIGLIAVWTWDARPYPAWPALTDVWGDTALWPYGHWLNGKVGLADLAALVAERCERVGFTAYDVSGLAGVVVGYVRDRPMSPRAEIELLMNAYAFDAVESEGVIRFVPRGRAAVASFLPSDCAMQGPGDLVKLTRAQETDLPDAISITFVDSGKSYRPGTVAASRIAGYSSRKTDISVPLVMDQIQARAIAERLLAEAWIGRETAAFALPPDQIALDAGDVVNLTVDGLPRPFRITRINDSWGRAMEAQRCEGAIYDPPLPGQGGDFTVVTQYGPALLALMDLPMLQDSDIGFDAYAAASASPFAGITLLDSATGSSYAFDSDLPVRATMGETLAAFPAGPAAYFDTTNTLQVKLYSGTLASAPQESILADSINGLAIENPGGDWEIVQFCDATLVSAGVYNLTTLLRGRLGTEHAMRAPLAAGARVVVLDSAIIQIAGKLSERNVSRHYKWGPSSLSQSDPSWQHTTFKARCVGLMPWSPVQLAGRRNAASDLTITWIRRTRFGGLWMDGTDVPLNEESEKYEVDILNGATVIRTIKVTAPSASYSAAQQTGDFGVPQNAIAVKVYQISATVGRGRAASATL